MKRLICKCLGHRPAFSVHPSWLPFFDGFLTRCERCGQVYEEKLS